MKLLEMKNRLALDTVQLLFREGIDVIFIGGTALNTFYVDYRYSEDLDLGYEGVTKKHEIETALQEHGYTVDRTYFDFRDSISFEGVSIKMDVVEYRKKYNGFTEKRIAGTKIKTLAIEEFTVEKIISFFTREELAGMGRDGYDIFSIEKQHGQVLDLARKAKATLRKNIPSLDYNLGLFEKKEQEIENAVTPYLRRPVKWGNVLAFLKSLHATLRD